MAGIDTPTGGNENSKSKLEGLTDKQKLELSTIIQQDEDYNGKEKLKGDRDKILDCLGDRDKILDYLRENCVKIEKNAKVMGYKGKKVHISLPKVGKFEGFEFEYFISDDTITNKNFESNPELKKKLYSINDICNLLKVMNRFMATLGIQTDGDMNYEVLQNKMAGYWRCDAGDCLQAITGLDDEYFLSDKDVAGREGYYAMWVLYDGNCRFCYYDPNGYRNLLLKMSD